MQFSFFLLKYPQLFNNYLAVWMCHKLLLVLQQGSVEAGVGPLADYASTVQNLAVRRKNIYVAEEQHFLLEKSLATQ